MVLSVARAGTLLTSVVCMTIFVYNTCTDAGCPWRTPLNMTTTDAMRRVPRFLSPKRAARDAPADGFGSQLLHTLACSVLSEALNRTYVHNPMRFVGHVAGTGAGVREGDSATESSSLSPQRVRQALHAQALERFTGLGSSELTREHVGTGRDDRWHTVSTRELLRYDQTHPPHVEVPCCQCGMPSGLWSEVGRARLRSRFDRAQPEAERPPGVAQAGRRRLAVHVRRGDIKVDSRERWVPLSYYDRQLQRLRAHSSDCYLYTDGCGTVDSSCGAELQSLAVRHDCALVAERDVRKVFAALVTADVLLMGCSALSASAAVLSRGEVHYYPLPNLDPLEDWLLAPALYPPRRGLSATDIVFAFDHGAGPLQRAALSWAAVSQLRSKVVVQVFTNGATANQLRDQIARGQARPLMSEGAVQIRVHELASFYNRRIAAFEASYPATHRSENPVAYELFCLKRWLYFASASRLGVLGSLPIFLDSDVLLFRELALPSVHCHPWQPCLAVGAPGAMMVFTRPALERLGRLIEHSYLDPLDSAAAPMVSMRRRLRRVTDMTFIRLLLQRSASGDPRLSALLSRCPWSTSGSPLVVGPNAPAVHAYMLNWSSAIGGMSASWGCVPALAVLAEEAAAKCVSILAYGAAASGTEGRRLNMSWRVVASGGAFHTTRTTRPHDAHGRPLCLAHLQGESKRLPGLVDELASQVSDVLPI